MFPVCGIRGTDFAILAPANTCMGFLTALGCFHFTAVGLCITTPLVRTSELVSVSSHYTDVLVSRHVAESQVQHGRVRASWMRVCSAWGRRWQTVAARRRPPLQKAR